MTALIKMIACMFTARPNSASPDNALRSDHRRSGDGGQRHQHGHQVLIDEDQDDQSTPIAVPISMIRTSFAELRRRPSDRRGDGQAGSRDCLTIAANAALNAACVSGDAASLKNVMGSSKPVVLAGQQLFISGRRENLEPILSRVSARRFSISFR